MQIEKEDFDRIATMIHSDSSPVGIDAKTTHIYIIHMLERLEKRLDALNEQVRDMQKN